MSAPPKRWTWEVSVDTSRIGLERFATALLMTKAHLKDSITLFGTLGRGVTSIAHVALLEGTEEKFKRMLGKSLVGELKVPSEAVPLGDYKWICYACCTVQRAPGRQPPSPCPGCGETGKWLHRMGPADAPFDHPGRTKDG